ncbi:MAG: hypothetical protein ACYS3N_09675 [Planctomycetota bacterium]|jgi:hypothetical protein
MKTKLKKLISKKMIIVPALVLLVVLGSALAKSARDPVVGSGQADAYMDLGYAVGTANIAIRGLPQPQATVVVTLGPPRYSDEGVLHATSSHIFYFGSGNSFTTEDKVIGDPTSTPGLLRLNETLRIVSGAGIFAGATGNLTVHGSLEFISLTDAEVTYDIRGSISIP